MMSPAYPGERFTNMDRIKAVFVAIIGIGLLGGGIFQLTDDRVMCGSQEMTSPNQVCEETKRGRVTATRTMEEQRKDNIATGWLLVGLGAAMSVGGTIWSVMLFRKPKAQATPAVGQQPQGYGPPPPGFDAQQGIAQQQPGQGFGPQHPAPAYGPQQSAPGFAPHQAVPGYGPQPGQGFGPQPPAYGPQSGQPYHQQPGWGPSGGQPAQPQQGWGPPH